MMRSLLAAAGLVILVNAFALVHVARNRLGAPTGEVTLTDRELSYSPRSDNSGVQLTLRWPNGLDPTFDRKAHHHAGRTPLRLGTEQLGRIGFNVGLPLDSAEAARFYRRQRPRAAYIAFRPGALSSTPAGTASSSADLQVPDAYALFLLPIDVDVDAAALRARLQPGEFVLPAVVSLLFTPALSATEETRPQPAQLKGFIREIPADIHVPRPFSDAFHRYQTVQKPDRAGELFRVRLRFGALGEPWVTAVEFPFESNPR